MATSHPAPLEDALMAFAVLDSVIIRSDDDKRIVKGMDEVQNLMSRCLSI